MWQLQPANSTSPECFNLTQTLNLPTSPGSVGTHLGVPMASCPAAQTLLPPQEPLPARLCAHAFVTASKILSVSCPTCSQTVQPLASSPACMCKHAPLQPRAGCLQPTTWCSPQPTCHPLLHERQHTLATASRMPSNNRSASPPPPNVSPSYLCDRVQDTLHKGCQALALRHVVQLNRVVVDLER